MVAKVVTAIWRVDWQTIATEEVVAGARGSGTDP